MWTKQCNFNASRAPPRPGQRPEGKYLVSRLKFGFFGLTTPGNFRDFLGDQFARVESSGDQNPTMPILHFHVLFFCILDPPKVPTIDTFSKQILLFSNPRPGTLSKWKILKFRTYWCYGHLHTTKFDRLGDKRRSKTWKVMFLKQFFQFVPIRVASWQPGSLSKWKISKFCIGYT